MKEHWELTLHRPHIQDPYDVWTSPGWADRYRVECVGVVTPHWFARLLGRRERRLQFFCISATTAARRGCGWFIIDDQGFKQPVPTWLEAECDKLLTLDPQVQV